MRSSHKVSPTKAAPAESFLKSAPQSLSATLQNNKSRLINHIIHTKAGNIIGGSTRNHNMHVGQH